jgi:hypothetical protein
MESLSDKALHFCLVLYWTMVNVFDLCGMQSEVIIKPSKQERINIVSVSTSF